MKRSFLTLVILPFFLLPLMATSALEFDGINDHVVLSQASNIGNTSNTVEAWVKIPVVGSGNLVESERVGVLLGNYNNTPNINYEIYSSGQLRFYWNGGELNLYGTTDLRDAAWHHIAFVRDVAADSVFLYIDGVLEVSQSGVGTNISLNTSFYVGGDRRGIDAPYFHGTIDELRIWTAARTQSEIREYMCEDVTGQTGLLSYYTMSDGSGITLSDNTGNGNTGTLTNMDNSDWVNDNQIPDGDGSTTPYQINGLNQLYWLSQNTVFWGADFDQITDITAIATDSWDSGLGWFAIGNSSTKFTGSYDGGGYKIDGLYIDRSTTSYQGLFGYTMGSVITNLGMLNVDITGNQYVGGVVGTHYISELRRCYSTGNISATNRVGGLVGNSSNSSVSDCYSMASITGSQYAGGFVGIFSGPAVIDNCYSIGSITGDGGFSGPGNPLYITNCFWDKEASGITTSGGGTGQTTEEMKTLSTYTDAGWDFIDETVNGTDNYWGINNAEHDAYPFLSWEDYTHNYSDTPLPVTLASFEAENFKGTVKLTWTTESETENLGYVLERKVVGTDWSEIATYLSNAELEAYGTTCETHDYMYVDEDVIAGFTYEYRLSDVSESNEINELKKLSIVVDETNNVAPDEFGLQAAYPNPFNPTLTIRYGLTEAAHTTVKILNLQGQLIATLTNNYQKIGNHELQWQAGDNSSGVYLVEVISGEKNDLRKVLLIK